MNQPEKLLQQYFGHASFRTGQKQAIDAILSGRDVLADSLAKKYGISREQAEKDVDAFLKPLTDIGCVAE